MAEELTFPNSHLELAKVLKDHNNCVSTTLDYLVENFGIDFQTRKQLEAVLLRVRSKIRKAKKDCLEGEWWHSNISMEPELKRNRINNLLDLPSDDDEEVSILTVDHRKSINNLSMQQQRSRLSSVLESIKSLSIIENTSEVKIAALALQLLSNQTDNRAVARVSKSIVYDRFPGQFGKILKQNLEVNKAVFLIDFLEIGRRKYTRVSFKGGQGGAFAPPCQHVAPPCQHVAPPCQHVAPPCQHVAPPCQHVAPPCQNIALPFDIY